MDERYIESKVCRIWGYIFGSWTQRFWQLCWSSFPFNALNKQEKGSSLLRGLVAASLVLIVENHCHPPVLLLLSYFPSGLRSLFLFSLFPTTSLSQMGKEGGREGGPSRPIEFVSPSRGALTNRVQRVQRLFSNFFFFLGFQRFSTWPTRRDAASDRPTHTA